jgi:hypothetical protein
MKLKNLLETKQINEASSADITEIPVMKAKQVLAFEKVLGGKHTDLWDGIHGYIVTIKVPNGRERLDSDDLKKLLSLKIRWIEITGQEIYLGF